MLALPIFPASRPASIVGADELNFCVRDGNRWTLIAINTNLYSLKEWTSNRIDFSIGRSGCQGFIFPEWVSKRGSNQINAPSFIFGIHPAFAEHRGITTLNQLCTLFPSFISLRKNRANTAVVTTADRISDTGSARNTAKA